MSRSKSNHYLYNSSHLWERSLDQVNRLNHKFPANNLPLRRHKCLHKQFRSNLAQ
jgi:hypothetical protein